MTSAETVDYLRGTADSLASCIEGDPENAPDISIDAVEAAEVVAGLRTAAERVEQLQRQVATLKEAAIRMLTAHENYVGALQPWALWWKFSADEAAADPDRQALVDADEEVGLAARALDLLTRGDP